MAFDVQGTAKNFFDRKAVLGAIDKGLKKALSKFGAFVWRRGKTSLKYGKTSSSPGKAPVVHRSTAFTKTRVNKKTGKVTHQPASPLRELTFFSFDPARKSVVIGPVPKSSGGPAVLRAIEYGKGPHAARPWLVPAFTAELPKAPQNFKSLIR